MNLKRCHWSFYSEMIISTPGPGQHSQTRKSPFSYSVFKEFNTHRVVFRALAAGPKGRHMFLQGLFGGCLLQAVFLVGRLGGGHLASQLGLEGTCLGKGLLIKRPLAQSPETPLTARSPPMLLGLISSLLPFAGGLEGSSCRTSVHQTVSPILSVLAAGAWGCWGRGIWRPQSVV